MADAHLLSVLREHLAHLSSDGSEARLVMAYWPTCVGGYACRLPSFNALGLRWDKGAIVFGDDTYFAALARFFDLAPVEADYLFGDHPDATGFDRISTFVDACLRIDDILDGAFDAP